MKPVFRFAGSTIVHSCGGWASTCWCLSVRSTPRSICWWENNTNDGGKFTLATLGTFILWLGWFGFNGGSQLAMGSVSDVADVSEYLLHKCCTLEVCLQH